jgi:hypothetical protein
MHNSLLFFYDLSISERISPDKTGTFPCQFSVITILGCAINGVSFIDTLTIKYFYRPQETVHPCLLFQVYYIFINSGVDGCKTNVGLTSFRI